MRTYKVIGEYGWSTTINAEDLTDAKNQARALLAFGCGDVSIERNGNFLGEFEFKDGLNGNGSKWYKWTWRKA